MNETQKRLADLEISEKNDTLFHQNNHEHSSDLANDLEKDEHEVVN